MATFQENLKGNDVTLETIKSAAINALPIEYQYCPWVITQRGGSDINNTIYTEEIQLNAYLASYTDWHKGKLSRVFSIINDAMPPQFNVIDWGCGQGLATLFLLDYIREKKIASQINQVVLIEPSELAINRAYYLIHQSNAKVKIKAVNKKIDNVDIQDIVFHDSLPVYQLFSNILDIGGIDLKHLTQILSVNYLNTNLLICVSPFYRSGNMRIQAFFNYFQGPFLLDKSEIQSNKQVLGYTYYIRAIKLNANNQNQIIKYTFYPPMQFRAAYELSSVKDMMTFDDSLSYFEVYAAYDLGAFIGDDIHPILAVINNIISRGLPTIPSPFVERVFSFANDYIEEITSNGVIEFAAIPSSHCVINNLINTLEARNNLLFGNFIPQNEVAYSPLAIARIQKLLVEILISKKLNLDLPKWNILVEEKDVPCAALAFEDFKQMFNTLTSMTEDYSSMKLPEINLVIISNEKYNSSPLHLNYYHTNIISDEIRNTVFDLVIHYSSLENSTDYTFNTFRAKNDCYFAIFSASKNNLYAKRYVYTTNLINYIPFTIRNSQGLYDEQPIQVEKLTYFLNLLFRKEKFRNGQLPILSRTLSNKSVIGLLPTGSGKSLTYQLAALLQPGVTIVIDPLVSLMKDQYDGLLRNGIDFCTFINGTLSQYERQYRETQMEQSNLMFVFLSPERLCIKNFRTRLKNMEELRVYFSYGVIDEVHCVSEWGHDFRFTYLHLGRNLYNYVLPKRDNNSEAHITLLGLTATASFDVLADVERELSGYGAYTLDSDVVVRYENTNRLELQYNVVKIENEGNIAFSTKWDVFSAKNKDLPLIMEQSCSKINELQESKNIALIKKRFIEREAITDATLLSEIENADLSIDVSDKWLSEHQTKTSAIVFCPHRQGSLGVYDTMNNGGILSSLQKSFPNINISGFVGGGKLESQDDFIKGKTSVMVATKAFGMGIDKPNVRFTYNVNFSGSLEAFVQEAGRAGRDRKMALATILYCPDIPNNAVSTADFDVHKYFFDGNFIGQDFEKKIMYHLMEESTVAIEEDSIRKSVCGFMQELLSTEIGKPVTVYISYSRQLNFDAVTRLNEWLNLRGFPPITFGDNGVTFVSVIEKAIYRMCCIGIVDDYTRDYGKEEFCIVAKRKSDEEYFNNLKSFLMRYYTEDRADIEMQKAYLFKGDNALQRCLGYITEFVYDIIASKRERAIHDMETFCVSALKSSNNWIKTNEDLKDFIYFYFNSKFARENYVAENGESYSLTQDTQYGKLSSFDILFKYMNVVDDNIVGASGSPKDNIKHLQGAVRLIRRSLTDSNPSLDLLNVYCLLYLNTKSNSNLFKELKESFIKGYKEFRQRSESVKYFFECINRFFETLKMKNTANAKQIAQLTKWRQVAEIELQTQWINKFKQQYVNN